MPDTIAAVATGGQAAAIGIIRQSGKSAISAADSIFRAAAGITLEQAEDRHMYYGELRDAEGRLMDMCLSFVSRAQHSYTGEDTVEFHCHGSQIVLSEVMDQLRNHGVRQAGPGEFTKRAFLNGKMDLTQAEAVIDLIEADTAAAARNAAGQLAGAIAVQLSAVYNSLLDVMAHFHAVLDYPDEDIDEFEMQSHVKALAEAREALINMHSTHERGKVLRDGIPAVITGRPNTGKSSLLNALLGFKRAIVTDSPGTTRDTIEEKIALGGIVLRLIDTAGIRKTNDAAEMIGVERTYDALCRAGIVIVVLDGSQPLSAEDMELLQSLPKDIPTLAAVNKSDLPRLIDTDALKNISFCHVSALTGDGLRELETEIKKLAKEPAEKPAGQLITNMRQADAIKRAIDSISLSLEAIDTSMTPDAVLVDIEEALAAIGEVTGKTMREDITDRIFERFCVGK